ncbi:hypothetical protein B0H12DRAFT_105188 [Mycena haematopus]|nr:hypothetical protein B0H12DRAFT_105188 [Mycena haematopus]
MRHGGYSTNVREEYKPIIFSKIINNMHPVSAAPSSRGCRGSVSSFPQRLKHRDWGSASRFLRMSRSTFSRPTPTTLSETFAADGEFASVYLEATSTSPAVTKECLIFLLCLATDSLTCSALNEATTSVLSLRK